MNAITFIILIALFLGGLLMMAKGGHKHVASTGFKLNVPSLMQVIGFSLFVGSIIGFFTALIH